MLGAGEQTVLGNAIVAGNSRALETFVIPQVFSEAECKHIIQLGLSDELERGQMQEPLDGYRRCTFRFIEECGSTRWIFLRLKELVTRINSQFGFQLSNFAEGLQFTRYESGGVIHWHVDTGSGLSATRKISISIQLSHREEYEGGNFEFFPSATPTFSGSRGSAIVFPSFVLHRVTEVTRGVRYSLVVWAHGPSFS